MAVRRSPTFKCTICGKHIENHASVRRHERYCRSKLAHPAPSRQKSCRACINAKARCDQRRPACGQCQRRGRECIYSIIPPPSSEGGYASSSTSTPPSQQEQAEAGNEALTGTDIPSSIVQSGTPSLHLLQLRKRQSAQAGHISKLIYQILCSYPERMIKDASYPPFIHHSTFARSRDLTYADDPILICQDIIRRYVWNDTPFPVDMSIWDAVTAEQERIYSHRSSQDKWLHLFSAQALTIYLLLVTAERETVLNRHPNLPITLLFSLRTNFDFLHQVHPGYVSSERRSTRPQWEDWIFAESKLRTALVYFILADHFDVDFGLPCDRDFDSYFEVMELPEAKTLWEAKDEASWQKEYCLILSHLNNDTPPFDVRLKYGELVKYRTGNDGIDVGETRLTERIERWHKEIDEFGMLVAFCSTAT
ncbi:hypothetical protein F5884DRAFT_811390 [Xylogone sp. PMI_703]|nr:hypothetical protein F5884DRAFT_811390 [Xylogone sp. PMI_703]